MNRVRLDRPRAVALADRSGAVLEALDHGVDVKLIGHPRHGSAASLESLAVAPHPSNQLRLLYGATLANFVASGLYSSSIPPSSPTS